MQYFTIFQDKLHSVNIQDDHSWAFSEIVKKVPKSPIYEQPVPTFDKGQICSATFGQLVFEWTLIDLIELRFNIIKNLLCLFFFYLMFL